jgi:hypothetical protein
LGINNSWQFTSMRIYHIAAMFSNKEGYDSS